MSDDETQQLAVPGASPVGGAGEAPLADPIGPDGDPAPDDETPEPAPVRRTHRGRWVLAAAVAVIAIIGVSLFRAPPPTEPGITPTPGPTSVVVLPPTEDGGPLATAAEVRERVALARAGTTPFASALTELIADADQFLGQAPQAREPLDIKGTDGPFVEDASHAYGLALAWVATGDRRYADAAADILRAWSTTTKTTKNTCATGGDCQTSLIIGRTAPGFVFADDLLADSGAMSDHDRAVFDAWLREVILPTASVRDNNWGDAGTFMRLAVSSHLGDGNAFDAAIARWRAMMDLVNADGHIPEEVRRGEDGITYTQEALQYKVASAVLAARRGIDLWSYRGTGGATLRDSIDYLASFADPTAHWPWDDRASFPTPGPMWELVHSHWPDPRYVPLIEPGRPFSDDGHSAVRWTTITSAGPLASDLDGAVASASPSLAAAPTPTPTATPVATATATATATPTDRPAAVLGAPTVMFREGRYRDLGRLPVRVEWSGTGTEDVRRYELRRSDAGHQKERVVVRAGHRTRHDESVPADTDLSWRLRVQQAGAGTSDWVTTDAHLRFLDDDASAITYHGTWHEAAYPGYAGGLVRWSDHSGDRVRVTFTGSGIAWLGPVGATRGRASVSLDGTDLGTVDLASHDFESRWVIYAADTRPGGRHTLEIRVDGGGRPVAVDGFVVLVP